METAQAFAYFGLFKTFKEAQVLI